MITGNDLDSEKMMMDGAIAVVNRYGFEGFTTKKWSLECGVAEGSLYYHFKNKDDLLKKTYIMIEHEIVDVFRDVRATYDAIETEEDIREYLIEGWKRYYQYLTQHPEKTAYYYRFHASPRFTSDIQTARKDYIEKALDYPGRLNLIFGEKDAGHWDLLWSFVIEITTSYAFRVISAEREGDETEVQGITTLLTSGVMGYLYHDPGVV